MPKSSGSKVTRAVRGTPSVFAHVIAFVLGGSLAASRARRDDGDGPASAPVSLPAAKTIGAGELEDPSVAAWEWAAEPAPQPAEFAAEGPAWSPEQIWERLALEDPDDFEPAPAMPIAPAEDPTPSVAPTAEPNDEPRPRLPHRFAATAVMVMLFFAGAALSAGAGDQIASMIDTTTTDATAAAPSDSAPPAADPAAPDASAAPAAPEAAPAADAASASADSDWSPGSSASSSSSSASSSSSGASASVSSSGAAASVPAASSGSKASRGWVQQQAVSRLKRAIKSPPAKLDPEASLPGTSSVVWLNRAMPDPTPAARRLTDPFAHDLTVTSKKAGADWALVLGTLRASGAEGKVPAGHATLRGLALRLANLNANGKDDHEAVVALTGDSMLADRAVALAHYDRAVGLWALVHGLEAAKPALTKRVLSDPRIDIYVGGREDLANGKINVRVIALMEYMADTFDQVTVSCLLTGHRLYARPGVVSAHMYGLAVDIAAVGGTTIQGNQEPGGITEQAVRDILLLPSELQPKQVISLLGLGGPSFPLPNHADHIPVGY
ncbi:MAG: hypothetical protein QOF50_578 [Gaiellaceae bacterium]|nr:hypothetical protein [Gaiellaceae bacterium]